MFRPVAGSILSQDHTPTAGCAWGDYDDGFLDLHVSHQGGQSLFHNQGDGTFATVTNSPLAEDKLICGGGIWGDYDNDGDLDLFVVTGRVGALQNHLLYENQGDGTLVRVSAGTLTTVPTPGISAAWGDYDNDGFLDLFVSNGAMVLPATDPLQNDQLFHNEGNRNAWLKVRCVGRVSNRSGVGARLRLQARLAGRTVWQIREISAGTGCFTGGQDGLLAHFGLGDASQADLLEIDWPSGVHQELACVDARQTLVVVEPNSLSITPLPGQGAMLRQYRVPGQFWRLERSVDLREWSALEAQTNAQNSTAWFDPEAGSRPSSFYRVRRP